MKKVKLHNYRCFTELSLMFSSKVTLFIGDNASGKTTIIKAITAVMNTFFIGFSDDNTRFTGLQKDDFRIAETETGLANEDPIKIEFDFLDTTAELQLLSPKGRTLAKPLKPIQVLGKELYSGLFIDKTQVQALPLLAAFSTSGIHTSRKLNKEPFKKYAHKPSFGYYECLQGDGLLDYWTTRLLVLKEAGNGTLETEGVASAIYKALGPEGCNVIRSMSIRPIQGKVYYQLIDGRLTDTNNLSDGLRRLVNMVMDIAFRCMILNGGMYGLEACSRTKGTVLIDEIDLHLHPSLQSVVVKSLQNAFPELQFIITSHAPMVMTGIPNNEDNKIIQLSYNNDDGYTAKEITTYGLDASTIILAILGVTPRSEDVEKNLAALFGFIDNDEYQHAIQKLNEMKAQFGDMLPELSKAEAMLNFLMEDSNDRDQ